LAMAMFTRSSGLIRWPRLSSPMSILTQAMSPVKWLSVGLVIGGCRIRSQPTFVGLAGGYCY
jgi:hypothetical protein